MNKFLDKIKNLLKKDGVSSIIAFLNKYRNYFATAGLFVVMVVILIFFTGEEAIAKRMAYLNSQTVSGENYVPDKEFEVDAYPEVNALIESYFEAYVDADFATLDTLATPISEKEKSYIAIMSQYYEEYRNITCYTKHGLSKDSYIVSVCFDIKFYDQDTVAPSMLNFYVQTNVDGNLYINNLYSYFNRYYKEQDVNKDVDTAIYKYVIQKDYLELYEQIEKSLDTILKENTEIYQLIKRTIPLVRQEWEDAVYYVPDPSTEDIEGTEGVSTTEGTETTQGTETTEGTETTQGTENSQEPETTPEPEPEPEPTVIKVRTKYSVNIRQTPSANGTLLDAADAGEVFVKLGEENGWTKVHLEEFGMAGYIKSDLLEIVTE